MRGSAFFKQIAGKAPFSKMHPKIAAFFKDYLSNEKVISFRDRFVVNTHFPPYPSRAFDNLAEHFNSMGKASERRLYSVTLAVTNRCNYSCWHCYNAGRSCEDVSLHVLKKVSHDLQELGAVIVTLSGGEPLLRADLEDIASSFEEGTCITINTTGEGLTQSRASALCESGVFAMGISLDSSEAEEHDRLRGKKGAFQTAVRALRLAGQNGLYPYIVAVATRDLLQPGRFRSFMRFAAESGALEVHLLEPCATGKLAGQSDVLLGQAEKRMILGYQEEFSRDDDLPILSTFTYLESPESFGCGAGLTHLYIDGSGEVCPCNLVPLSFGNICHEPIRDILEKMGHHFRKPRATCLGRVLAKHIPEGHLPTVTEVSYTLCERYLPHEHAVPRFFQIQDDAHGEVGRDELRSAYDRIHGDYDEFWLTEAGRPVVDLIGKLTFRGDERVLEAGCGTGFATVLLAKKLKESSRIFAVDISKGMLIGARDRAQSCGIDTIRFIDGDALEIMLTKNLFDIIFSSWVLGYIPLKPFFAAAGRSLTKHGRLAFIVHKENSPQEPLEIFGDLVAQDPSILQKRVAFDFPRDFNHVTTELAMAGLEVEHLCEGKVVFQYDSPEQVLEHLLKSGAGTAFYDAIDPHRRDDLEGKFLKILCGRRKSPQKYEVIHDYISCIAVQP